MASVTYQCRSGLFQLLVVVCLLGLVRTESKTIYLDSYLKCGQTYVVGKRDEVMIEEEHNPDVSTNGFAQCAIMLKAKDLDGRLCIAVNKLEFKNCNLQLVLNDGLSSLPNMTQRFNCQTTNIAPEWCSTDRYVELMLEGTSGTGRIRDVDILLTVRNMRSEKRIAYLDTGCGSTYMLLESTVTVKSRQTQGSEDLPSHCSATFKYLGDNGNDTVCLTFSQGPSPCPDGYNFELQIKDGTRDSYVDKHSYSCSKSEPQKWCSESKSLTLQLTRSSSLKRITELEDLFALQISDSEYIKTVTNGDSPNNNNNNKTTIIIVVVIMAVVIILVLVVAVVIYTKRRKQKVITKRPNNEKVDVPLQSQPQPKPDTAVEMEPLKT